MKSVIVMFLALSFIGVAVFGVFIMSHDNGHDHGGSCIAATVQGTDCPIQNTSLDYLTFHLNAFKSFSTAAFGENLLASLLALVFLVAGTGLGMLSRDLAPPRLSPAYSPYRQWELLNSSPKYKLTRWLALHENSPASL